MHKIIRLLSFDAFDRRAHASADGRSAVIMVLPRGSCCPTLRRALQRDGGTILCSKKHAAEQKKSEVVTVHTRQLHKKYD